METQEITIDTLIERGKFIKNGISEKHFDPGSNVLYLGPTFYYLNDQLEYETWKNDVIRYISKYYAGDISIQSFKEAIIEFEKRHNSPSVFNKMLGILESCKNIPKVIEKKSIHSKVGTQVNVHNSNFQAQTQQQTQSIQIFLDAIKDELTGKQQKELAALAKEELPEPEKRTKIIDKLKSFGLDTLSNIIANIATNSTIWGYN